MLKSGPIPFQQKAGAAFGQRLSLFGLHEQKIKAGTIAVRDEMLHSIDDPAAVGFLPGGAKRRCIRDKIIRAIVGLGNADRQHSARILGERRQHPRLLFRVERFLHYLRDLQGLRHDDRNADIAYSQFLDNHGRGQRIGSQAAPFLVQRHGADTDLVGRLDNLPGKAFRRIFLGIKRRRARLHFAFDKAFDGFENETLIFRVDENVMHDRVLCACPSGCDRSVTMEMASSRLASPKRAERPNRAGFRQISPLAFLLGICSLSQLTDRVNERMTMPRRRQTLATIGAGT